MEGKERAMAILEKSMEFEVIDEKAKTKRLCKFVSWTHNNKMALLRDVQSGKNFAVDAKMFVEFIGL
jgi:hypothetical protein